ncbi:XRE family transcriptional regulator [Desulfovibrio sp. OttesenSCG-928-A18]|nr:XRE family transcriptional regulator [Desulfovibrio sp. OttesenSCG-928-A18]
MKERQIISATLKFWLKKKNMKQNALAELVGVEPSAISQFITKKKTPSLEVAVKMADAFDVSLPEFFACKDDSAPDLVLIQRVKARPSAGTGSLETDAEHDGLYAFHDKFITRKRGTAETMRIFAVSGDSMEPTLSDGDLIMINERDTAVTTGQIYLLRIDDELMVKRLETRPGTIVIRSDNKEYREIVIHKDNEAEMESFQVFGRMVWSCREY